jgi:hypothetical protein
MSFDARNFSVLAYANGFTHWHYRTADSLTAILAAGYFAPAAEMLRPGDQITMNFPNGSEIGLAQAVVSDLAEKANPRLALLAATQPCVGRRAA